MSRRYFSSTYVPTTITSGINATDVTITVAASSGVPASLPWTGVLERGTSNEDLVTVTAVSGTTYTIARGIDGQSGKSHLAGASFDHVVSARDFDEPNAHVNDTTLDQHTQYGLFKKGLAALIGAAGRAGKMYYKTDLDYLTYDDGSAFHDFQSKAVADAAYAPLTNNAAWSAYTPSFNGALGNGTLSGRYKQNGKTVHFVLELVFGSTSTMVGPGTFGLPVAAGASSPAFVANGFARSASTFVYTMLAAGVSGGATTVAPVPHGGTQVGPTAPITWANGDQLWLAGTYESA